MNKYALTLSAGRYHTKTVDSLSANLRTAFAIGLGAGLAVLGASLTDWYYPLAIGLIVAGAILALVSLWDRVELERTHLAHAGYLQSGAAAPYEPPAEPVYDRGDTPFGPTEPLREIVVNANGKTSTLLINSPEDDKLVYDLCELLGRAALIAGKDGSVFPPYRKLDISPTKYDRLLNALGETVVRQKGASPSLKGWTFGTLAEALSNRVVLPFRLDASQSENRLKQ